ncbi:hypothetical protein CVT24_007981 [Panaeolus cyanescens]|uniref:GST N-terminal domain-containing protein n=1 Tax=Panaeolus cyanescens TaxID=181874 RepID=A0A409YQT3_9AGAR|nr:hypothetical protein CVT24_007981 [Panaeolus cyanescens]
MVPRHSSVLAFVLRPQIRSNPFYRLTNALTGLSARAKDQQVCRYSHASLNPIIGSRCKPRTGWSRSKDLTESTSSRYLPSSRWSKASTRIDLNVNTSCVANRGFSSAAPFSTSAPRATAAASNKEPLLLHTFGTPNGRKVSIYLEELKKEYGLEYESQKIDISQNVQKEPWFIALNPNGRIPVLVDRQRGNLPVFETAAILLYLAHHYDVQHRFCFDPHSDPDDHNTMLQWMFWALTRWIGTHARTIKAAPVELPYAIKRYFDETERLYSVLEIRLADRDFLAGPGKGQYSLADINAFPWIAGHEFSGIENLKKWPKLNTNFVYLVGQSLLDTDDDDERTKEMLKPSRSVSFSWNIARHAPKYPRPRPGTAERPAYHAPDPLVNNSKAAVTELEEGALTFIHRPPPTAPSPFSTTLDPVSPLLRPSASTHTGPLPPRSRSTQAHPLVQLTDEQRRKMKELRVSDPAKYTRGVLAKMFNCSTELVGLVAALPKPQRKAAREAREEIHQANREKWSEKHSLVMAIRKKRREMW